MRMKGVELIRMNDSKRAHTFEDWNLILKSRPVISPPEPKTVYVDLPGTDGHLDLTESLNGEVVFNPRNISMEFQVIDKKEEWPSVYSDILDFLHGRTVKIVMDDDLDYYYVGRVTVEGWDSRANASEIKMKAVAEPYKMERSSSMEDWEWDPFNFEIGVIREYRDIPVNGSRSLTITGSRKPVIPSFTVTSDDGSGMSMWYAGEKYNLSDGLNHVVNIRIKEGNYNFVFEGNGTVSVDYRGGRL